MGPAECAFVGIVVGRIDGFGDTLHASEFLDCPAVLRCDVRGQNTSESAMVTFHSHDSRGGDAQIGSAELARADQIRGKEGISLA